MKSEVISICVVCDNFFGDIVFFITFWKKLRTLIQNQAQNSFKNENSVKNFPLPSHNTI